MKAFGIEIRKPSTENIYRDVDLVLGNKSLSEVQSLAVAHSLQKMLEPDSYFNICTVTDCQRVCSIVIPKERLDIYNSIHCLHWSKMLPDFRTYIIAMLLDDFRTVLNPLQK